MKRLVMKNLMEGNCFNWWVLGVGQVRGSAPWPQHVFSLSDMPVSGAFCTPATSLKGSVFGGLYWTNCQCFPG